MWGDFELLVGCVTRATQTATCCLLKLLQHLKIFGKVNQLTFHLFIIYICNSYAYLLYTCIYI